jgi:hypothetical protein
MCGSDFNGNPVFVYTSTNSGETWNLAPVPGNAWNFVASSADGKTLVASCVGQTPSSPLYISINSGASWTSDTNETWADVACSADGAALLAVASTGFYTGQFTVPSALSRPY